MQNINNNLSINEPVLTNTSTADRLPVNRLNKISRGVTLLLILVGVIAIGGTLFVIQKRKELPVNIVEYSRREQARALLKDLNFPIFPKATLNKNFSEPKMYDLEGGIESYLVNKSLNEVITWYEKKPEEEGWLKEKSFRTSEAQHGFIFEKEGWKNHVTIMEKDPGGITQILHSISYEKYIINERRSTENVVPE